MAIKDWRKLKEIRVGTGIARVTGFFNLSKGTRILLITHKRAAPFKHKFEFRPGLISQIRFFKTKQQLLRHAKSYMRKN